MKNWSRKILLASSFAMLAVPPTASAGFVVINNGGGISENNIVYAWQNLEAFVLTCYESKECGLSVPERAILKSIRESISYELKGVGVQFKSGRANPGFFELDDQGEARSAVTGNNIGDPIVFNVDRLYPLVNGVPQPFEVLDAVSLLIHELGHHHGIDDHAWLDRIGSKVKQANVATRNEIHLGRYGHNEIKFSAFNPGFDIYDLSFLSNIPSRLIFSNNFSVIDLSSQVVDSLPCPKNEVFKSKITTVIVQNLSWERLLPFDAKQQTQRLSFKANVDWKCNAIGSSFGDEFYSADLHFTGDFRTAELKFWGAESELVPVVVPGWFHNRRIVLDLIPTTASFEAKNCTRYNRSHVAMGSCLDP